MRVSLHHRRPAVHAAGPRVRRGWSAHGGETLIELLIAIVLMGVAFAAILNGMVGSARIAKNNQEATRANTLLSAVADRLLDPKEFPYRPCAAANNGFGPANSGDTQWAGPAASAAPYGQDLSGGPVAPLRPTGWRVRIKDIRYLLGPDYFGHAPNKSFAPNADNVIVPQWSSIDSSGLDMNDERPWGNPGFYKCFDLKSMYPADPSALPRDGGMQQLKLVVEKPDGAGGYVAVDQMVVTKRDQRCPTTNYSNADRGPC